MQHSYGDFYIWKMQITKILGHGGHGSHSSERCETRCRASVASRLHAHATPRKSFPPDPAKALCPQPSLKVEFVPFQVAVTLSAHLSHVAMDNPGFNPGATWLGKSCMNGGFSTATDWWILRGTTIRECSPQWVMIQNQSKICNACRMGLDSLDLDTHEMQNHRISIQYTNPKCGFSLNQTWTCQFI